MPPTRFTKVRSSTKSRPAVRSEASTAELERSLRRLGADEQVVALVTGGRNGASACAPGAAQRRDGRA